MLDVPTSSHSELKGTRVGSSVTSLLSASHASVAKIVFRLGVTVGMRSAEVGAEVHPFGALCGACFGCFVYSVMWGHVTPTGQ